MGGVTVIIPTRERPELLRTTLHSILTSATEAERHGITTRVLVVDDASSTDGTRRLAKELSVDYARIDIHNGRNNPAAAIAKGVGLVDSEFFTIFGDDDIMLPRFIGAHMAALAQGYDVCASAYLWTDDALRTVRDVRLPEANIGDLLAGRITINDGAMTRVELVRDMVWDPTLDQVILYPIWLGLLYGGARFTRLDEPTFLYRRHQTNVSDRRDPTDAGKRQAVQEQYRELVLARDGTIPPPLPVPQAAAAQRRTRPIFWRRVLRRLRASARGNGSR